MDDQAYNHFCFHRLSRNSGAHPFPALRFVNLFRYLSVDFFCSPRFPFLAYGAHKISCADNSRVQFKPQLSCRLRPTRFGGLSDFAFRFRPLFFRPLSFHHLFWLFHSFHWLIIVGDIRKITIIWQITIVQQKCSFGAKTVVELVLLIKDKGILVVRNNDDAAAVLGFLDPLLVLGFRSWYYKG